MQKLQQFYVLKFNSSRLYKDNYNINITMKTARKNGELISLGDNQVLRSIRKIKGKDIDFDFINSLFRERRKLTRRRNCIENKQRILQIDKDIDNLLFIPEYISVVIEKHSHYKHLIKHKLVVNGKKYVRLLCGAGNARRNTVFFVQEDIYDELDKILCNGHNEIKITENKYNAYYALSNSATYNVSEPRVCVVPDKEITMTKTVDWVIEKEPDDIIEEKDKELTFNLWDGMGICSPELAEQWSKDLELDYIPCSFCIRNYFVKGMVCVFDFHKFSREVAHTNIIKDLYGNEVNTDEIDMIITESQFKLWKGYDSWEHYLKCCEENDGRWGVTKFSPKQDKTSVFTNYQFLQVLNLDTSDKIEELCTPTVEWLDKIISQDSNYTLLYLLGSLCDKPLDEMELDDFMDVFNSLEPIVKALILNRDMLGDTYIKTKLARYLNTKINESYIGKLLVNGNFQTMLSDPYSLCEHIYGMEVKGLLNEFEHYSRYWNDRKIDKVVAMRAPLTWRSEANILNLQNNDKVNEWYKYLYSGIIYNVWGIDCMLHADSDFDGDLVFTTDNSTMINNVISGNPITYAKKPTEKKYINKNDLYKADLLSFDSKIGYITNCSTTLYAMLPLYKENTPEYNTIMHRLKECRVAQGNEIDKAKGLIVKSFPKHWTDWTNPDNPNEMFTAEDIRFNNSLLIDKRPYFMKYLYPKYKSQYNEHKNKYDYLCYREFGIHIDELLKLNNKTEEQECLVNNYNKFNQFLETNCPMNNICRYMEKRVKEIKINAKKPSPDYIFNIIFNKNIEITENQIKEMEKVYKSYRKSKSQSNNISNDNVDFDGENINIISKENLSSLNFDYISDDIQRLANLAVYVNYYLYPKSPKNFCWDLFGEGIVLNIYDNSNKHFTIPLLSNDGDIEYMGKKYKNKEVNIECQ